MTRPPRPCSPKRCRQQSVDARLVEAEELRLYHQLGRDPDERLEKPAGIGVRVLVDGA